MSSPLTELSTAELRDAGDAIETLIDFRDYLPLGGSLLTLAAKFRDDIRSLLDMEPLEGVSREPGRKNYKDMGDVDLDRLIKAVVVLHSLFPHCMAFELRWRLATVVGEVAFEKVTRIVFEAAQAL